MSHTLIFPGTFDPITLGHLDLIERSTRLCSTLIVAVANSSGKQPLFTLTERMQLTQTVLAHLPSVHVVSFSGLLVNTVKEHQAQGIIRGLRNQNDYTYELALAQMNQTMDADCETLFLTAKGSHQAISSSLVREIASMHDDITPFVPQAVCNALQNKHR